jgi:hypothetical protein
MITIPTSQIHNTDLSRRSSIRHGGARPNARLRSQLGQQSAWLKADSCTRSGPIMRGNVTDQRIQWRRLPALTSSAALKSP